MCVYIFSRVKTCYGADMKGGFLLGKLASAQYFTLRIGLVGQSIGQAGASQLYYLQLHVIFRKVSDPSYIKITLRKGAVHTLCNLKWELTDEWAS